MSQAPFNDPQSGLRKHLNYLEAEFFPLVHMASKGEITLDQLKAEVTKSQALHGQNVMVNLDKIFALRQPDDQVWQTADQAAKHFGDLSGERPGRLVDLHPNTWY